MFIINTGIRGWYTRKHNYWYHRIEAVGLADWKSSAANHKKAACAKHKAEVLFLFVWRVIVVLRNL